ncbi:MAG: SOS response-associated peptidase, partial [Streptosporangiaceae bacterium]
MNFGYAGLMCGRFTLRKDSDALAAHFEVEDVHPLGPRYNIAPSQQIPVVRVNPASGRRELAMQRWGLDPPWSPGRGPARMLINARAETLAARPTFREAFRRRRCLIPADGFYEWEKLERSKQPW